MCVSLRLPLPMLRWMTLRASVPLSVPLSIPLSVPLSILCCSSALSAWDEVRKPEHFASLKIVEPGRRCWLALGIDSRIDTCNGFVGDRRSDSAVSIA